MTMTKTAMQAAIDDPSTGSIRRRWLRRALAGVVAVGPNGPPAPAPVTRADLVRRARQRDDAEREDAGIVRAEIAAINRRIGDIDKVLKARPRSAALVGYEQQELEAERRHLGDLRREIEADAVRPARDCDGRPLDARWRAIRRDRTRSLRESAWSAAEAARAEGDHRRARQLRIDALRARHLAEVEFRWRNLSHYW